MKKLLILTAILAVSTSTAVFADTTTSTQTTKQSIQANRPAFDGQRPPKHELKGQRPPKGPDFQKRNAEFEKRLNLSDEQKKKAENMRKEGFEKMKPIMDKMHEKQKEAKLLKEQNSQSEKLQELQKEIGALRKEAHKMRQENMKEFESILDKKQLKELNTMKEEGRKKFEQMNKQRKNNGMPPRPPKDFE